jgi:hypothetical protein
MLAEQLVGGLEAKGAPLIAARIVVTLSSSAAA